MKNTIRVFCLLSVCLGLSACSDDSHKAFTSFEEVCLFSNGKFKAGLICECGGEKCDSGVVCENGKCANKTDKEIIVDVRCEAGTTRCKESVTQTCENGIWGKDETCELGCTGDGLSCAECDGDEKKCDSNILKSCSGGRWMDVNCQFGCSSDLMKCG